MCNVCCKEFKGWCKAFTRTEVFLAIIEALLLIFCIGFLIFLILHIMVCSSWISKTESTSNNKDRKGNTSDKGSTIPPLPPYAHTTLDPRVKCTWEPSKKTEALIRYYLNQTTPIFAPKYAKPKLMDYSIPVSKESSIPNDELPDVDSLAFDEQSDGEEADHEYKSAVLALVKLRPPRDVTFGCVLAVVSDRWTLTAASCIEAIEEIDSLDNFVLMERYGEARHGRTHALADVQLHPQYQGANRSYDVAALRSEDSLESATTPLALPTLVDHLLITVGEKFTILGFGSFRTIEQSGAVRAVSVYTLPGATCDSADRDAWATRRLLRGREDARSAGGCGIAELCVGVRYARGQACTFCAGTPLVRGGVLLGVQAGARACAVACEPAPYASMAAVRDWIDMILDNDD